MTPRAGAAIVAVGNELLSGKVEDLNVALLTRELRLLGLPLLEVRWIPDELERIAETFREVSPCFEVVFSSGGVGPTHDDVTLAGIARGFGVRLARNARLEDLIRRWYGASANEAALRMADLPEGTVLVEDELDVPVVLVRNVYVLPGEPVIFRKKFAAIRERFRRTPFHLRKLFTRLDEPAIAADLAQAERRFEIAVGSYPRYDGADYRVMVTLESKDRDRVEAALDDLRTRIPAADIVRVE